MELIRLNFKINACSAAAHAPFQGSLQQPPPPPRRGKSFFIGEVAMNFTVIILAIYVYVYTQATHCRLPYILCIMHACVYLIFLYILKVFTSSQCTFVQASMRVKHAQHAPTLVKSQHNHWIRSHICIIGSFLLTIFNNSDPNFAFDTLLCITMYRIPVCTRDYIKHQLKKYKI